MAEIQWHLPGAKRFETGVDHGVLYLTDPITGAYNRAYAWNGLVSVTESPSGAESTKLYADNTAYLNMISAEEFAATIEAYTYPDEFAEADGSAELAPGIIVGQQRRKPFGFSYRTLIGDDLTGTDAGEKIHLVYGAQAAPTEKARTTVNDSPDAVQFSWETTTTPVPVPGLRPTAHLSFDSISTDPDVYAAILDILYGRGAVTLARLPLPTEIYELVEDATP